MILVKKQITKKQIWEQKGEKEFKFKDFTQFAVSPQFACLATSHRTHARTLDGICGSRKEKHILKEAVCLVFRQILVETAPLVKANNRQAKTGKS